MALTNPVALDALREVGFEERQAEVIANLLTDWAQQSIEPDHYPRYQELRDDVNALRREIKDVEGNLRQEIKAVESVFRQEIKGFRSETKATEDNLRQEIKSVEDTLHQEIKDVNQNLDEVKASVAQLAQQNVELRSSLVRWIVGIFIAFVTLMGSLLAIFLNIVMNMG